MIKTVCLDLRLALVASFVRNGSKLADVGTDHGYLIGNLAFENKILGGIACDINQLPLEKAKIYLSRLGVADKVKCVLSDGLKEIPCHEVDDIVIAGMGGDLIVHIVDSCEWSKNKEKSFILQPMTKSDVLRDCMWKNGFSLEREEAVVVAGKTYSVMKWVHFDKVYTPTLTQLYVGRVAEFKNNYTNQYLQMKINYISKKAIGLQRTNPQESSQLFGVVQNIKQLML